MAPRLSWTLVSVMMGVLAATVLPPLACVKRLIGTACLRKSPCWSQGLRHPSMPTLQHDDSLPPSPDDVNAEV
jgi:hypothetical protein